MKRLLILTAIFSLCVPVFAEAGKDLKTNINWQLYIVPAAFIGLGTYMRAVPDGNKFSKENIQHDFAAKDGERENWADDYLQFVPLTAAVGLPLLFPGIEHRSSNISLLSKAAVSQVVTLGTVTILKNWFADERPNGDHNSFPSGHTAEAFMGAQILYLEYRDSNKWIAYAGYPVAAFVGVDRVINNAHWMCDVLVGAGIGMLVPTLIYWADYLWFEHKENKEQRFVLMPTYSRAAQNKTYGLSASFSF